MDMPFDINTFLHCPQGPRLKGVARVRACHLLYQSIDQSRVRLVARILTRDPSLITEKCSEAGFHVAVVEKTLVARMDVFAQFALEHGVPVTDTSFGRYGLLDAAINAGSPGLASIALLYGADPNQAMEDHPDDPTVGNSLYPLMRVIKNVLGRDDPSAVKQSIAITYMLLDAGANPGIPVVAKFVLKKLCIEDHSSGRFKHELGELLSSVLKAGGAACRETVLNGKPILYAAAEAGNMRAVRHLIAAGANPEGMDLATIFKIQGAREAYWPGCGAATTVPRAINAKGN